MSAHKLFKNKQPFIHVLVLTLLFIISVMVRMDNLKAPIGRHHEWLTGHVLGTTEVLQKNGIAYHHYCPVFTFNAKADRDQVAEQTFKDKNNYAYYVSYPPMCFLLPYYAFTLSGQDASVTGIRILSLLNDLLCALLVYFLTLRMFKRNIRQQLFIPAIIAYALYLFATGNLWFHAHVYFADMQVHLFILSALYITFTLIDNPEHKYGLKVTLLGLTTFLGVYTEWLAVFIAFFSAGFFLLLAVKNKKFHIPFLVICFCTFVPILLTLYQYSHIAGFELLKEHLTNKFMARSGYSKKVAYGGMSLHSKVARAKFFNNYETNYDELLDFAWLSMCVGVAIILLRRLRKKTTATKNHLKLFTIILLAIVTHHMVFFNFTVVHDFSSFKCSLFLPLLIAFILGQATLALAEKSKRLFSFIAILISIYFVHHSIQKYYKVNQLDWKTNLQKDIGEEIKANAKEDEVVLAKTYVTPEITWYAKRNVVETASITDAQGFLKQVNYYKAFYVEVNYKDNKYLINSYKISQDNIIEKIRVEE